MFRAHSDACLPQSGVDPKLVDLLLGGELVDDQALKSHVYCVLLKCKMISKDGKLQKAAILGKMANRADGKNDTKVYKIRFSNVEIIHESIETMYGYAHDLP